MMMLTAVWSCCGCGCGVSLPLAVSDQLHAERRDHGDWSGHVWCDDCSDTTYWQGCKVSHARQPDPELFA